jgi:hypothetical protein
MRWILLPQMSDSVNGLVRKTRRSIGKNANNAPWWSVSLCWRYLHNYLVSVCLRSVQKRSDLVALRVSLNFKHGLEQNDTSSKTDVVTGVLVCTWNIRYRSFVFFPGVCLEYVYKGISMFFCENPYPRENNDLEFVQKAERPALNT